MNSLPPDSKWERTYWSAFSRDAHQLVALGYFGALSLIGPDQEEPEITGLIVDCIRRELNVTTCKRYERYSLHEESPFAGEDRLGTARRRLDVFVESHSIQPRPRYIFEAKYGAEWPVAAMIGYVQSDVPVVWQAQLDAAFKSDSEERFAIEKNLSKVCVITLLPDEWSSEHRRKDNGAITIFHILLNCTGNP